MVTVKRCTDLVEATSLKLWLENAGIKVSLPGTSTSLAKTRRPSGRPTPIRLEVAQQDAAEARRLLAEIRAS